MGNTEKIILLGLGAWLLLPRKKAISRIGIATGSKEFYDMRAEFEKAMQMSPFVGRVKFDKETDSPKGYFYQDGHTNQLFHAFMLGYGSGRLAYM